MSHLSLNYNKNSPIFHESLIKFLIKYYRIPIKSLVLNQQIVFVLNLEFKKNFCG
jgi:hypothetical protein